MSDPVEDLMIDLVIWLGPSPRPYGEVMEAWRTSCPRLTVWEDAVDAGLVARRAGADGTACVAVTKAGRDWLAARRGAAAHIA